MHENSKGYFISSCAFWKRNGGFWQNRFGAIQGGISHLLFAVVGQWLIDWTLSFHKNGRYLDMYKFDKF